jgi:hypothetical protein
MMPQRAHAMRGRTSASAGDRCVTALCSDNSRIRSTTFRGRSRSSCRTCSPYIFKTKSFHSHVSGPHFRDYHLILDVQGEEFFAHH